MRIFIISFLFLIAISSNLEAACYQYGSTVTCDDGNTYQKFGNTTYGSNSRTGSSWNQTDFVNSTYGNDSAGNSWSQHRFGNTVYGNDSNGNYYSCYKIGNQTYCN